jgi:hypothetical protein
MLLVRLKGLDRLPIAPMRSLDMDIFAEPVENGWAYVRRRRILLIAGDCENVSKDAAASCCTTNKGAGRIEEHGDWRAPARWPLVWQ